MKRAFAVIIALLCVSGPLSAQLKSQAQEDMSASRSLIHPSAGLSSFFGLFSAENFRMRHSVSMSFLTSGGQGVSIADYTNSMFYKIADPLDVRMDLTLQGSPFGQYGNIASSSLNGLFLSRAELNYRPSHEFQISLQYQRNAYSRFGWYDSPFSDHRWGAE